jgi:hypothetical protein
VKSVTPEAADEWSQGPEDLAALSYEAMLYLYPLVLMDVTRLHMLTTASNRLGSSCVNQFVHTRDFPPAEFRSVVRPNFDTLYSTAWLDLSAGPVVLRVPDTGGRYYLLSMMDMWTDVFAAPGKRTTGTAAAEFIITGHGTRGQSLGGRSVITAPTPHVWIIGRTQTHGAADCLAVHEVQDGYEIVTSAEVPSPQHRVVDDIATEPRLLVNGMTPVEFFCYAAELLAVNPPHPTDFSQVARIARMGLVPGKPFNTDAFTADRRAHLAAGWYAALDDIAGLLPTLGRTVNGWNVLNDMVGVYGNSYVRRAAIAMALLGANPPEDAVYLILANDANGHPVIGENHYILHFDTGQLPPAAAFWSVTVYDGQGFPVANDLNRFALGDRDPLCYNADGSLDLFLQRDEPDEQHLSNWLPVCDGPLGVTMRLYLPSREALNGTWAPPPIRNVGRRS